MHRKSIILVFSAIMNCAGCSSNEEQGSGTTEDESSEMESTEDDSSSDESMEGEEGTDPYGPCPEGKEQCLEEGSSCMTNPDESSPRSSVCVPSCAEQECPSSDEGEPGCSDVTKRCFLRCMEEDDCPSGMSCLEDGNVCTWLEKGASKD